jgi:hypothetical protein
VSRVIYRGLAAGGDTLGEVWMARDVVDVETIRDGGVDLPSRKHLLSKVSRDLMTIEIKDALLAEVAMVLPQGRCKG